MDFHRLEVGHFLAWCDSSSSTLAVNNWNDVSCKRNVIENREMQRMEAQTAHAVVVDHD